MNTHEVIDNFLPEETFVKLEQEIVWNNRFPWCLMGNVANKGEDDSDLQNMQAVHHGYEGQVPLTSLYNFCEELLRALNIKALIRIKANFYPYTSKIFEHGQHYDYPFNHKGALLSLNTCNGFTRLEDSTKVLSKRNRLLLHNPSKLHNSTTTTNAKGRFNININYL